MVLPYRFCVCWGITGAVHYLRESVEVIRCLRERGVGVTVYVSYAGKEVLRMCGLLDELVKLCADRYPTQVVFEDEEGRSFPRSARVYLRTYRATIVSPATLNTMSKIAYGIADTLVTNLVAHSLKSGTPVYLVPSDKPFAQRSRIPIFLDRGRCACERCSVVEVCPRGAIYLIDGEPHVNLLKCDHCLMCVSACPRGAIVVDREIEIRPHPLTAEIIERLVRIGVRVLDEPRDVIRALGVE